MRKIGLSALLFGLIGVVGCGNQPAPLPAPVVLQQPDAAKEKPKNKGFASPMLVP